MFFRREFAEDGVVHLHVETGIAALDRVADAIVFAAVEEDHLIGFGDRIGLAHVAHEDAAIGIDEACSMSAFLAAFSAASAVADHIPK
ncbi:hypothetical protein D3C71_2041240 [compost metagenome]